MALATAPTPMFTEQDDELEGKDLDEIERFVRIHQMGASKHSELAVVSALEVGRGLAAAKIQLKHGEFVAWAEDRFGYKKSHVARLLKLHAEKSHVGLLLQENPSISINGALAAIADKLKEDKEAAPPRREHVFPVATPADIVIQELDAAELPPRLLQRIAGKVDLVLTSWPYCLGQDANGYIDCADYVVWTRLAHAWADTLEQVLAPNGRAVINLPVDVRKNQPVPRPIVFDAFRILSMSPGLRYATAIVWVKSANGHRSNTVKRGSAVSPNAPALATGDELLLVFHKGEWNLGRAGEPNDLDQRALEWTNAHWVITGRSDKDYPHVFPDELVSRCITLFSFPGHLVADFHCGSGQVPVGALRAGRRFVGGDLNPYAVALSTRRVEAEWSKAGRTGKG